MILSEESRQRLRQMLLDMRQEMLDQVKAQNQIAREINYKGDWSDRTTSSMAAEHACMLKERFRERILLIEEALDAIENGDYGLCEECEEPINEKRLLLMPFTRLCVPCQSELERQAKLRGRAVTEPLLYRKAV